MNIGVYICKFKVIENVFSSIKVYHYYPQLIGLILTGAELV